MDKKYVGIIIILLIIIACLLAGILINSNLEEKTKQVDVGVGKFNCSVDKNFTVDLKENGLTRYWDHNRTDVSVMDFNNENDSAYNYGLFLAIGIIKGYPSQTIDDVIIYNSTATKGDHVGEIRYIAILENSDKNITVEFSSPSVDETIKLYKSFEFN